MKSKVFLVRGGNKKVAWLVLHEWKVIISRCLCFKIFFFSRKEKKPKSKGRDWECLNRSKIIFFRAVGTSLIRYKKKTPWVHLEKCNFSRENKSAKVKRTAGFEEYTIIYELTFRVQWMKVRWGNKVQLNADDDAGIPSSSFERSLDEDDKLWLQCWPSFDTPRAVQTIVCKIF